MSPLESHLDHFFTSPLQYGLVFAVIVLAETVYVTFGFGSGLIAVGLLALFMPEVQDIVVLLLLLNLPAEIMVAAKSRQQVHWRSVAFMCSGMAIGVPVGTWVLNVCEPTFLLVILGGVLALAGGAFLAVPDRTMAVPEALAPPTGVAAGLLGGMFGTGGPPLILFYQLRGVDKVAFRGTLMAIFMCVSIVRLPSYLVAGLITAPRLWSALVMVPALLLGMWLGNRVQVEMSEQRFRQLVSVALVIIGLMLLGQHLL